MYSVSITESQVILFKLTDSPKDLLDCAGHLATRVGGLSGREGD